MYKKILLLVIISVVLSSCSFGGFFQDAILSMQGKFPTKEVKLRTASGEVPMTVEVADDVKERQKGYMKRKSIDKNAGMLFVFEDQDKRKFWMKDTILPLDIIFFNKDKVVVDAIENMEPCTIPVCPIYTSVVPAMYGMEVPAGFVKEHQVKMGDVLLMN